MTISQKQPLQLNIFDIAPYVKNDSSKLLNIGPFTIFPDLQAIFVGRKQITLRPQEYKLFLFMLRRPMRILSRNLLLEYVWGFNTMCSTNTVDVHLSSIRRKLAKLNLDHLIETVYGVGFIYIL